MHVGYAIKEKLRVDVWVEINYRDFLEWLQLASPRPFLGRRDIPETKTCWLEYLRP